MLDLAFKILKWVALAKKHNTRGFSLVMIRVYSVHLYTYYIYNRTTSRLPPSSGTNNYRRYMYVGIIIIVGVDACFVQRERHATRLLNACHTNVFVVPFRAQLM